MEQLGIWYNRPCEWTKVRRSKVMSRTPTRYKTCIKRSRGITCRSYSVSLVAYASGATLWILLVVKLGAYSQILRLWSRLMDVWLPSTLLARTICPYHQCYLLYNLSFCACLVVYRAASLTSIWLVGSPLVVLNGIKTWIRKIVHPKWKETRQLMNEWKATKVHVYVQCFNFLSKPERTY